MAEIYIHSIKTANPRNKISQKDALEYLINSFEAVSEEEQRKLNAVFKRSGIDQRYTVVDSYLTERNFLWGRENGDVPWTHERMELFKTSAVDLAAESVPSSVSIEKDPSQALITVSCTGLMAPGLEILLSQKLGIDPDSLKMAVNFMGCYGTFHAWKMASGILHSQKTKSVLITSTELCSIHFQKNMRESDILGNALFGDGAASCLMASEKLQGQASLELIKSGNHLFSDAHHDLKWDVTNTGFEMVLSTALPGIIKDQIPNVIRDFLQDTGISMSGIDHYAIHPGGKRILDEFQAALSIEDEAISSSREILREYGNMSSASILFVLKRTLEKIQQETSSKNILSIAFGPGFTIELALFRSHV